MGDVRLVGKGGSQVSRPWLVADGHVDSLGDVVLGRRRLGQAGKGQWDAPRSQSANVRLQTLACWVEPRYKPERALAQLLALVEAFWEEVEVTPGVRAITRAQDLEALTADGAYGWLLAVEGVDGHAATLSGLRLLFRLGVRLLSLTWNERNGLADGAGEDPGGGGLSRAGRAYVREMNRLGMVVDVAHLAEAGFWDVLDLSERPVLASHANCWTLAPHPRNLRDRQLRALARQGGMVGLTFVPEFLGGTPSVDRVVDHVLHVLDVVGDDRHVGWGSDFDGVEVPVPGLASVADVPRLAERMLERGLSETTVARVMGENLMAFWQQALP
ncbi:MAG: membrane dipeptidase [Firmicutes bacterium]|nr:membrane dipeptidase [Alicyclobacillaceae bacterium]MCL6496872.1 membrane dipeptidase [Bacillota bacterium]